MSSIASCLWFDTQALEAAERYCSLFDDARITAVSHYGEGMPLPAGTPLLVEFTLAGQRFQGLNGGPLFPQSEAFSISVSCRDQAELDQLWNALTADGGRESMCGWLKDRFGVSWQLVPQRMSELMASGNGPAIGRMMGCMMSMKKLDIAALEAAYQGDLA
jgi:predicted 3-demethylubiquinone-9 3-methyltransferase (glyoxalase superfamily)